MKLQLKQSKSFFSEKLLSYQYDQPCLDASWHYHKEYELLYVSKGSGIRFVGDSVQEFNEGELVLVGAYLPHLWRNDLSSKLDVDSNVKIVVIKFLKDFIGKGVFDNPEFYAVKDMLKSADLGVLFSKETSQEFKDRLLGFDDLNAPEKSIELLSLLHELSLEKIEKQISTLDMRQYSSENGSKLDEVMKFISINFASSISLKDVAEIACMTENSFCRYFKNLTNKSFVKFLNEVRIRNAAKLLVSTNKSISEIAMEVGFPSITNFNKQFKIVQSETPKIYRERIAYEKKL